MYKVARVIMYPNSKKSWIGGKIGSKKKKRLFLYFQPFQFHWNL